MLTIQNLDFSYKTKQLYKDLNLDLEPGKICGLLGKNGAGKSTLFKLIAGLLEPSNGLIEVNGLIPSQRTKQFYQSIFFYPENIRLPNMIISDFVKTYSVYYPSWNEEQFLNLLGIMSLDTSSKLSNLSHGQIKKFYLAFALSTNCSYLLLDEPTSGLDIPSKKDFRKFLINSLNENQTIIISSHQVKDFNKLLDDIIIVDSGKVIFNQPLYKIEEKLGMKYIINEKDFEGKEIFYEEEITGGKICLGKTSDIDEYMPLDIEILFNAVTSNSDQINNYLNS